MLGRAGMFSKNESIYFEPTQLLFPVKHKDYNKDPFIRSSWQMLQYRLNKEKCNTHNVTVFGYSAPISDVEALDMMKSAWGDLHERNLEQLEFIDIRNEEDVIDSWSDFIHTHHYDYRTSFFESSLAQYPRRTDEAFFCHFFPITPEEAFVEANPVPQDFKTLKEMWDWYEPLVAKERPL